MDGYEDDVIIEEHATDDVSSEVEHNDIHPDLSTTVGEFQQLFRNSVFHSKGLSNFCVELQDFLM